MSILQFVPHAERPPSLWHQEIVDPMDGAVFDGEAAAQDIAEIIHRDVTTIDEALTVARRVEALIVTFGDVAQMALAKANRLLR